MTTVSVALCTFNGSRFLAEQLHSIARQTRLPDEMVVCDDVSTDGTPALVRDFASEAPFPIRFEPNPTQLGIAANFSRAISLCTGSVVALSDQDDVWAPTKLERQVEILARRASVGAVFSDADLVDEGLNPLGMSLFETTGFSPARQRRFRRGDGLQVLLSRPVVCGATLAFRSSYRKLLLPIPPTGLHDIWLSVLLAAATEVVALEETLVLYRQHGGNQIGAPARGFAGKLARRRERGVFGDETAHFDAISDRLAHSGTVDDRAAALLGQKVDHLRFRHHLPVPKVRPILGELARGRYHRFSRGLTSAGFDMFFRETTPVVASRAST